MKRLKLKIHHIVFKWYYKKSSDHFKERTFKKSVKNLIDNYEHAIFREKGLEEVIRNASKREQEMRTKISNLELKLRGVPQHVIDPLNKMFGTDLKGVSDQEQNN
ncbi:hypothetical protein FGF1_03650 [Flavobacteriaceae bacterium GF1]